MINSGLFASEICLFLVLETLINCLFIISFFNGLYMIIVFVSFHFLDSVFCRFDDGN